MSDLIIWSVLCLSLGWILRGIFGWWEISFYMKQVDELRELYIQKIKDVKVPEDKDEQ